MDIEMRETWRLVLTGTHVHIRRKVVAGSRCLGARCEVHMRSKNFSITSLVSYNAGIRDEASVEVGCPSFKQIRQVRHRVLGNTTSVYENRNGSLILRDLGASLLKRQKEGETDRKMSEGATCALFPNLARNIGRLSPALAHHIDSIIIHFLPKNYRTSVPATYFTYSKWYALGAIVNSASLVLSTQSMLYAVGLGAGAIPVAAALNWVLKDGLGQLGGILFTSYVNNRFDADPKRWRMVAAIILDLSSFLEAATPLFPTLFLPFAALGNAGKNVSWLAASATRAGIHMSFAKRSNLADLTGKAGSQGVLCSLLGTTLGITISPFLGSSPAAIIPALVCFSAVHLLCMHQALRSVALSALNAQALDMVAMRYIQSEGREVLSREEVGSKEVVVGAWGRHLLFGYRSPMAPELLLGPDIVRMAGVSTLCSDVNVRPVSVSVSTRIRDG